MYLGLLDTKLPEITGQWKYVYHYRINEADWLSFFAKLPTKMVQKPNLQKKTIDGKKVIISAREAKKNK